MKVPILYRRRRNTGSVLSFSISASQNVVASRLYEGQTVEDMENYSTLTSTSNFSSSAGSIVSAVPNPIGVASLSSPLSEGDVAGFSVTVTDSEGNVRVFSSNLISVEYIYEVVTVGNEAQFDINTLVPDSESITFQLSGFTGDNAHYNDDYTFTAGYLRATNPVTGTQKINFDGNAEDLVAGDSLRANDGLWVSETGSLSLSRQFDRNSTAISGATGSSYSLVSDDISETLTLDVTADDGTNPTVTATSASVVVGAADTRPVLLMPTGQSNARIAGNSSATPPSKYTSGLGTVTILVQGVGISDATLDAYDVTSNADPDNTGTAWGVEAEFIYQMRQAGDNRPVVIVKEAVNGQNLATQWNPATTGDKFESFEDKVARARVLTPGGFSEEIVVWNQGEADATDDTNTANYLTNFNAWFTALRSRVTTGQVIVERIRPLGYAAGSSVTTEAGYARAWQIREAQIAAAITDGNAVVTDTDFDQSNFNQIHPPESWGENRGLRVYAAWQDTYDGTYGAITDTTPASFSFTDQTDVEVSTVISSDSVLISGIERQSPVTITGGEWRTLNSLNSDSVVQDWTSGSGFVDKFQKVQVRGTSSASTLTQTDVVLTVGGVSDTFSVTTNDGSSSFETETDAFVAQAQTNGGSTIAGAEKDALNDFYITAKASTWWDKLEHIFLRLADDQSSRLSLKDQSRTMTNTGLGSSPYTWSEALGWSTSADSNEALQLTSSYNTEVAQDDASVFIWYSTLATNTRGDLTSSTSNTFARFLNTGSARTKINQTTNSNSSGLTSAIGMRGIVRSGASSTSVHGPDGSIIDTDTDASAAVTATTLSLGNPSGNMSDATFLGAAYGEALTETECQSLSTAVNTLHAAFSSAIVFEWVKSDFNASGETSDTITVATENLTEGDVIYTGILVDQPFVGRTVDGISVNSGSTINLIDQSGNTGATDVFSSAGFATFAVPSGATFTVDSVNSLAPNGSALGFWKANNVSSVASFSDVNNTASDTASVTFSVQAGDVVLAAVIDDDTSPITWTGVTTDGNRGGDAFTFASAEISSDNASYTVSAQASTSSDSNLVVLRLRG